MDTIFSQILWMIFSVPEIFIMGDFFTELTQLKFPSVPNLTFLRTVVIIFLWWSFLPWLFLLVVISISACLCLQEQYKERNQDSTHYALAEFIWAGACNRLLIWGSHFCGRSGRLTCLCKALNDTHSQHWIRNSYDVRQWPCLLCYSRLIKLHECFVYLLACLARCAKKTLCAPGFRRSVKQ